MKKFFSIISVALVVVALSGNTVKTKVKMSVWSRGEEQEATGTINGNDMNFKLAKNGSNYVFSKK